MHFNSHAHVERDHKPQQYLQIVTNFNSHAHVERDEWCDKIFDDEHDFNSHAHVERDILMGYTGSISNISTHTLTWSVTNSFQWDYIPMIISTHTLTWSVTSYARNEHHTSGHFNSHAHVERDEITAFLNKHNGDFNSHAHVERDS